MRRTASLKMLAGLILALVLSGLACSSTSDPTGDTNGDPDPVAGCMGCHGDKARLQATADPDTSDNGEEPAGEG
jgi:hypothetical protein